MIRRDINVVVMVFVCVCFWDVGRNLLSVDGTITDLVNTVLFLPYNRWISSYIIANIHIFIGSFFFDENFLEFARQREFANSCRGERSEPASINHGSRGLPYENFILPVGSFIFAPLSFVLSVSCICINN